MNGCNTKFGDQVIRWTRRDIRLRLSASAYDARGNGDGDIVSTLTGDHENRITDYTACVVQPVYCIQGNAIDRAYTAECNGKGCKEDICYTLNTIDRPGIAFAMQSIGDYKQSDVSSCLKSRDYKDAADLVVDCAGAVRLRYIVRRLTPTECARLQGFTDSWGIPEHKDSFFDEEYEFWLNVRNTYAGINGRSVKCYKKEQMLKWYHKLHTDSSEYKMWGNGIALPCALYVMQGIMDAVN